MKTLPSQPARAAISAAVSAISLVALSACTSMAPAAGPADLALYAGRPLAGSHVTVADSESHAVLTGATAEVPKPAAPKVPPSRVSVSKTGKDGADDALSLRFTDSSYASLSVEAEPGLDLRPYLARGVLAFDLNVKDLAQGGLSFKVNCGKDCERKVPYLIAGRAAAGKGWRHLAFALSCFVHEGDDFSAIGQPFAVDASGTGELAVANVRMLADGTPNASCPDYRTISVTPDLLNESWSVNWWLPRHQEKLAEIAHRAAAHEPIELVFIGDSITHNWEKDGAKVWERNYGHYHALDLGFGGDRTENILWRLQHGEIDGIHPKVAVMMLGTNNTGQRQEDPRTTAAGVARDIAEVRRRLPDTKILLLAVFPRDATVDGPLRQRNAKVNAIISGFADNQKVFFLNINQAFLDANGGLSKDIMPDLLHPNERGYEMWAAAMAPTLQRLMRQP